MSYQKIADLIEKLYQKTGEGQINWETTSTEGVYQAILKSYSVRILKQILEERTVIVLQIYNEEGDLIEEVNDEDVGRVSKWGAFATMLELYESARRTAMGTEKAVDEILEELNKDDVPF